MTAETVTRRHDPDRFEIGVDGEVAGFSQFVDTATQRIFYHTEIADEFGGRGLAGTLTRKALELTRAEGLCIVPVCPYVARYVTRHNDFVDIVDPVTPEAIATLQRLAP